MMKKVQFGISWLVIAYALTIGSIPVFMLGFMLAALASGHRQSPVLSFAVVKGMNFTRGKLGNVGFRQQYVKEKGSYKRRTVAFQLPDSVSNPRTTGQVRQRTKFKLIQAIGSALASKGITYNFYRSGRGISGYNAFIRDGIKTSIVEAPDGTPYVDWKTLKVTNGDFYKAVQPYQAINIVGDDCHCARLLAWNYDWTCDPDGNAYALNLIGIKVDQEGAIEDVVCVQPRVPLSACQAEVLLPSCDCCKTYWYAYFVDPYTGYFSNSVYIGTCDSAMSVFDPSSCVTCTVPEPSPAFVPPSEQPDGHCGDDNMSTMARGDILYTGASKIPNGLLQGNPMIYPACPMLQVTGKVDANIVYQISAASEGLTQIIDNNDMVVAEWTGTGNGDADWKENQVAYEAVTAMGYSVRQNLEDGTVDIWGTNGRILSKLVHQVDSGSAGTTLFTKLPNTEVLDFLISPATEVKHLLVVDSTGTVRFNGDPMTLNNGILSIVPGTNPPGIGSVLFTFTMTPKDGQCPNAVITYEFDGGSLAIVPEMVTATVENDTENDPQPTLLKVLEQLSETVISVSNAEMPELLVEGSTIELFDKTGISLGLKSVISVDDSKDSTTKITVSPVIEGTAVQYLIEE